jgi:predicted RNA-binding protein YlxR (DUF448 family)
MAKPRHEPVRTCVGCRGEAGKAGLTRVVRGAGGGAAIDPTGSAAGRGAYVHTDATCVDLARKRKALERALRTTIQPELWSELAPSPRRGEGRREGGPKHP